MADILIKIPDGAFGTGEVFDGQSVTKTRVIVPLRIAGKPWLSIGVGSPVEIDNHEFQPDDSQAYQDILQLVDKGMIEFFEIGADALSVAELITLFKASYQEL